MKTLQSFSSILDAVEKLSIEDQEALIEVIKRRILELRRSALANEVRQAQREFKAGECPPASPSGIMNEMLT